MNFYMKTSILNNITTQPNTTTMSKMSNKQQQKLARETEAREAEAREAKRVELEAEIALYEQEQEQFQIEHDLQFFNKSANYDLSIVKTEPNEKKEKEKKEKQEKISKKETELAFARSLFDERAEEQIQLPRFCNCTNHICAHPHRKETYINHAIHSLCDKCLNISRPDPKCRKNHDMRRVKKTDTNALFDDALNRQTLEPELLKITFNTAYHKHSGLIRKLNDSGMDIILNGELPISGLLKIFSMLEYHKSTDDYQRIYLQVPLVLYKLMYELQRRSKVCSKVLHAHDVNGNPNRCNGDCNCLRGVHDLSDVICIAELDGNCTCFFETEPELESKLEANDGFKSVSGGSAAGGSAAGGSAKKAIAKINKMHLIKDNYIRKPQETQISIDINDFQELDYKPSYDASIAQIKSYFDSPLKKSSSQIKKEQDDMYLENLKSIQDPISYDNLVHGMIQEEGTIINDFNYGTRQNTKCKKWISPLDKSDFPKVWQDSMFVHKPNKGMSDVDYAELHKWTLEKWTEYVNYTIQGTVPVIVCLEYTFSDFHKVVTPLLYAFRHPRNKQSNWYKYKIEIDKARQDWDNMTTNESFDDDEFGEYIVYSLASLKFDFNKARTAEEISKIYKDEYAYYLNMPKNIDERIIGNVNNIVIQTCLEEKPELFDEFVKLNIGSTFEHWLQFAHSREYKLKSDNINVPLKTIRRYLNLNDTTFTLQECIDNNFNIIKNNTKTKSLLDASLIEVKKVKEEMKKMRNHKLFDSVPITGFNLVDKTVVNDLYQVIHEASLSVLNTATIESELDKLLSKYGSSKLLLDIQELIKQDSDAESDASSVSSSDSSDSSSSSSSDSSDSDSSDSDSSDSDSSDSDSDSGDDVDFGTNSNFMSNEQDSIVKKTFDFGFSRPIIFYEDIGIVRSHNSDKSISPIYVGPIPEAKFPELKRNYRSTAFKKSTFGEIIKDDSKLSTEELALIKKHQITYKLQDKIDTIERNKSIFAIVPLNGDKDIPPNLVEAIMKVLVIKKDEIYIQDDINDFNINTVSSGNVVKHVKSTENKVSVMKEQKNKNIKKVWNDTRNKTSK